MESRARASGEQFATLLEFMESHGDLAKPQPGAQGRLRADRLWQSLSNTLNSIGGGVNKSPDKWKKVWADWKSKTKKKALTIRRHASGTGGGPNSRLNLTALEARVLGVIGALAVEGQSEIEEQGFDTPTTAPPQNAHLGPGLHNVIEDGMVSVPSPSPPLPAILLPSRPSTSRQQISTAPAARLSPPRPAALPTPSTPPSPIHQPSPISPHSTPTRRRRFGARRRRALTPFDRATSEFVAVEQRRLQLEEKRENNEARRIEVDHERTNVLSRFVDIAEAFLQQYLQSRDRTE